MDGSAGLEFEAVGAGEDEGDGAIPLKVRGRVLLKRGVNDHEI